MVTLMPRKLGRDLIPGATVKLQISAPSSRNAPKVHFELTDPPEGVTIEKSSIGGGDTVTIVLACDAAKAKPGLQGNLILTGYAERPNAKGKNAQRTPLGCAPAIPFEIAGTTKTPSAD